MSEFEMGWVRSRDGERWSRVYSGPGGGEEEVEGFESDSGEVEEEVERVFVDSLPLASLSS